MICPVTPMFQDSNRHKQNFLGRKVALLTTTNVVMMAFEGSRVVVGKHIHCAFWRPFSKSLGLFCESHVAAQNGSSLNFGT